MKVSTKLLVSYYTEYSKVEHILCSHLHPPMVGYKLQYLWAQVCDVIIIAQS